MKDEIWLPIIGYEGLYEISNYGRVKRLEKLVILPSRWGHENQGTFIDPERILVHQVNPGKRLYVSLCKEGKRVNVHIHKLIATHFIPNPNNYPIIRHLNDNNQDNRLENLEWGTHKMNSEDAIKNSRLSTGENHYKKKLSPEVVKEVREKYTNGVSLKELSLQYNRTIESISHVERSITHKKIK